MDPKEILKDILATRDEIFQVLAKVKINKKQCSRLFQRIDDVCKKLQALPLFSEAKSFIENLDALRTLTLLCNVFIEKFACENWFLLFLRGGLYASTFTSFNRQLEQMSNALLAPRAAVTLQQEDAKDQEEDSKDIRSEQNNIVLLQRHRLCPSPQFPDQQKILEQQMASMARHIEEASDIGKSIPVLPLSAHHFIPFCDLVFERLIDEDQIRTMYVGHWHDQAVLISGLKGQLPATFMNEAKIASHIKEMQSIVHFYGVCLEPQNNYIVMEYMPNSSLFEAISRQKLITPMRKNQMALEIAEALQLLHVQKIIYGGLNSKEVLFDENWHAKITGFKFARMSNLLAEQKPDEKADVYDYGVVLWELLTEQHFLGDRQVLAKVDKMPKEYRKIVCQCCDQDPAKRPSIQAVVEAIKSIEVREAKADEYERAIRYEKQKNLMAALKSYQLAATLGHVKALTKLGFFYYMGKLKDLPRDVKHAYDLFSEAAQHGDGEAKYIVGKMLETGAGTSRDLQRALQCYHEVSQIEDSERGVGEAWFCLSAQMDFDRLSPQVLRVDLGQEAKIDSDLDFAVAGQKDRMFAKRERQHAEEEKSPDPFLGLSASFHIAYEGLHFSRLLGSGHFGQVYKGVWLGSEVAIKELKDVHDIDGFTREVTIMASLNHQNAVKFYGITPKPKCYMVMEFCHNGSLDNFLPGQPLNWKLIYRIAADVANGLTYLHDHNVIHGDIKTTNILLDTGMRAKLADFGLSRQKKQVVTSVFQPSDQLGALPIHYMAPELLYSCQHLEGKKAGRKSDVYSYGTLLWEMVTRKEPFAGLEQERYLELVMKGGREKIPDKCEREQPKFAALIKGCWDQDPGKRPTAKQAFDYLQAAMRDEKAQPEELPRPPHDDMLEQKTGDQPQDRYAEPPLKSLISASTSSSSSSISATVSTFLTGQGLFAPASAKSSSSSASESSSSLLASTV